VFFDNLQVVHKPGPMIEETHYYPFGLVMQGISSKAASSLINKKLFNDGSELQSKEFSDGSGLEMYTTTYRNYDPQIGRFHQIDPLADVIHDCNPYAYVLNNPLLFNDPHGLDTTRGATPKAEPVGGDVWIPDDGEPQIYNDERNNGKGEWTPIVSLGEVVVGGNSSESNNSSSGNQAGAFNDFLWAFGVGLNVGEGVRQGHGYYIFKRPLEIVERELGRGNFVHTSNGKIYSQRFRGNQYISSNSVKGSLSTAKFVKNFGKGLTVVSVATSIVSYANSDKTGADKARLVGSLIITGSAAIPVVGPLLAIGLGIADSFGAFDKIYESFND
jgi:RHS repeat-associated protein